MAQEQATGFPGVPTIFAILLSLKDLSAFALPSLRYFSNTAAALPPDHIRRLRAAFPRATVYSMYGLTECTRVTYLPPEELDRRPGSVGKGMPNEEVWVETEDGRVAAPGEVGELVIRGSNVMRGYWENPEATARCLKPGRLPGEVVLRSGDLFKTDADGFLYFVGRRDDIIKTRGEKVSPREVENVLHAHEGVREAAGIGVPHPVLGQAVKAFVVLRDGADATPSAILAWCRQRLEDYMVPKEVVVLDNLPKTPTGKVRQKELS
jgi:acyl-CoA synthetase (AMP-forming)/AMP-acid ligase II